MTFNGGFVSNNAYLFIKSWPLIVGIGVKMPRKSNAGYGQVHLFLPGWLLVRIRCLAEQEGECYSAVIRRALVQQFGEKDAPELGSR